MVGWRLAQERLIDLPLRDAQDNLLLGFERLLSILQHKQENYGGSYPIAYCIQINA